MSLIFLVFFFFFFFFFFNDTATTEIYTLSLHDALPISLRIWFLWRSSLRERVVGGLFQLPGAYGAMLSPSNQTSPLCRCAYASARLALRARNDLTSVPVRTRPASHVSRRW